MNWTTQILAKSWPVDQGESDIFTEQLRHEWLAKQIGGKMRLLVNLGILTYLHLRNFCL